MNAITLFPVLASPGQPPLLPFQPFADARAQADAWRGQCLDSFTQAEAAVTETLITLAAQKGRGKEIDLPHLVGQRMQALADAIAKGGPFAAEGACVGKTLQRFRTQDDLRTMLCHGIASVTLDRHGEWTLVLRLTALNSGEVERDVLVLTESEAAVRQRDLARFVQSLRDKLRHFGVRLTAGPNAQGK